ncbi:uncharacterized protein EI90DRAFT_3155845 [Cantharellus anzutake]|uniref:uncharacterized protein n=1 Tax=Cantharellus anzutake TaxID=1750568 RepID=UPI00190850F5|nr:uncharacterized protein EI90DRAFT_3155845 [Cantharellus anzutake]KAF8328092.1 hypothetical protein EI90DRAFT_3155845 [Cantharellus anzutake]
MSFQPGIPYVLINTKSNTALDLHGINRKVCSELLFRPSAGDPKSDATPRPISPTPLISRLLLPWTFESVGAGLYIVKNGLGKYIGLEIPIETGKRVSTNDTPRLYWSVEKDPSSDNVYRIFLDKTKLSLDLANNGSSANETPAIIWYTEGPPSQSWRFERA